AVDGRASGRARRAPARPSNPPRLARPRARHWLQGSSPSTVISLRYAPPRRSYRSAPPLPGIVPPTPVGSQPHVMGGPTLLGLRRGIRVRTKDGDRSPSNDGW